MQGRTRKDLVSEYRQYQDAIAEEEGEIEEKYGVMEQNRKFHHMETFIH